MERNTIFITGAASGIGKETALLFSQKGWFVGLFDIDLAGLEQLQAQIGADRCCVKYLDVRDRQSVSEAIRFFTDVTDGAFNVLFNNAGIIEAGAIDEIDLEAHKRILDVNVWGVINCTVQALPFLKRSSPACIVNMSSASALYGHPFLSSYAASKMAVRSLTEGLDIALAKHRIKVCDLMPLWVHTNLAQHAADQWQGLDMQEVTITSSAVAEAVWKAIHGKRLHWLLGRKTHLYHVLGKILPSPLMRMTAHMILKE